MNLEEGYGEVWGCSLWLRDGRLPGGYLLQWGFVVLVCGWAEKTLLVMGIGFWLLINFRALALVCVRPCKGERIIIVYGAYVLLCSVVYSPLYFDDVAACFCGCY